MISFKRKQKREEHLNWRGKSSFKIPSLIKFSDHCIDRYKERINREHTKEKIIQLLANVYVNGKLIVLDKVTRVKNLLKYHCEEANYYRLKNIVIVVKGSHEEDRKNLTSEKTILTCYPYHESKFMN